MLLGSAGCSVGLLICGFAANIPILIAGWLFFQFFVNAITAGLIAVVPDRVPTAHQGSYSAVYGVSLMAGAGVGTATAGAFVSRPSVGFFMFAVVVLISGTVMALLAPDRPSTDLQRSPLDARTLLASFSFPTRGARDFYLAGAGKFLFVIAAYSVSAFQLYILTDFIGLPKADAGGIISITALINLVLGLLFGSISGAHIRPSGASEDPGHGRRDRRRRRSADPRRVPVRPGAVHLHRHRRNWPGRVQLRGPGTQLYSADVATGAGRFRTDAPARKLPERAWQKLSAGCLRSSARTTARKA
ncbi:hypothetical protein SNL152K_593 [Streptomyces sp. NL15-2K]|nr:hypothetical protein SNL152K_593 [Streptomyces sp. NL15-2K]